MVEYAMLVSNVFGDMLGGLAGWLNTSVLIGSVTIPLPVLLLAFVLILTFIILRR